MFSLQFQVSHQLNGRQNRKDHEILVLFSYMDQEKVEQGSLNGTQFWWGSNLMRKCMDMWRYFPKKIIVHLCGLGSYIMTPVEWDVRNVGIFFHGSWLMISISIILTLMGPSEEDRYNQQTIQVPAIVGPPFPYHSYKNPLKYGNDMGGLMGRGSHY